MADVLGTEEPVGSPSKRSRPLAAVAGLSAATCDSLRSTTLHQAACDGVLLGADGPFAHAPCSLLPYPVPASLFMQAHALATPFNALLDRVSRDTDWLLKTVRSTTAHDPFTKRLLELCEEVAAEGVAQPLQLSINRSDYMIDQPGDAAPRLLQVELNTISVSFVSLGAKMSALHRHSVGRLAATCGAAERAALERGRPEMAALFGALAPAPTPEAAAEAEAEGAADELLPANESEARVASGLARAHAEYAAPARRAAAGAEGAQLVVLMVVQPAERNVIDQRGIEAALWRRHGVPLVRLTLAELAERASLDGPHRRLVLSGGLEVSTVYLRAGYTPDDYPSEAEWAARRTLERSSAVKCPSVAQHLAGTKKVQQALSCKGELERFVSPAQAPILRNCFAGLYGLDEDGGAAVDAAVCHAIDAPLRYVLKPQREGGGNNLYGAELAAALVAMGPSERASFILMDRITPPSHAMPLMRNGALDGGGCTCELGVFGVMLSDGERHFVNEAAGHLLRVKLDGVDEGGVCAGFAVLSSPVLFP